MFVQGHGQKSEQKHRTKNFAKLPNHLPLLTMVNFTIHSVEGLEIVCYQQSIINNIKLFIYGFTSKLRFVFVSVFFVL